MEIIEYNPKYDEQIKDLLDELQEHLVEIDDWNTQILHEDYREENFKIDMRKVEHQEGKIYLAIENNNVKGLIMGAVEKKDEIDIFGPNKGAYNFYSKNGYIDRDIFVSKKLN